MAPPYMFQLCQKLFSAAPDQSPDDFGGILTSVCTNWFHQAFEHCSVMLNKKPGCQKLWSKLLTLKRFLFPENATSLLSKNIPISVHPDQLTPMNCQELANQVVRDYIFYIPRYMAVLNENHCLWLILRGILGVTVIVICVIIVARHYNSFQGTIPKEHARPLTLQERLLDRNIKRVLYETKYLSVVPVLDPQILLSGCPAMGLKIDVRNICDFEAIVLPSLKRENAADGDNSQTVALDRLQRFFQNSGKYRLLLSIDLECREEKSVVKPSTPSSTPTTPRSSGIPVHKPTKRIGIRRRQ